MPTETPICRKSVRDWRGRRAFFFTLGYPPPIAVYRWRAPSWWRRALGVLS